MSITSIGATPPVRLISATPSPIAPVQPVAAPEPLAPAVRVDIRSQDPSADSQARPPRPPEVPGDARSPEATMEARIRIDQDTKVVVYQQIDPSSGDVVVQLPDPVVLKARAYAEAAEARARPAQRPLDRTA